MQAASRISMSWAVAGREAGCAIRSPAGDIIRVGCNVRVKCARVCMNVTWNDAVAYGFACTTFSWP